MANYYCSSLAGGGGTGTILLPFTLQEGMTFSNGGGWVDGDTLWLKADGLYTVAAYNLNFTNVGSATKLSKIRGYSAVIGDDGRAQIKKTGGAGTSVMTTPNYWNVENVEFNGNSAYSGYSAARYGIGKNLVAINCTTTGLDANINESTFINCRVVGAQTGIQSHAVINCFASGCSVAGYTGQQEVIKCTGYNNSKHYLQGAAISCIIGQSSFDVSVSNGIELKAGSSITGSSISGTSGTALFFVDGVDSGAYGSNVNLFGNVIDTNDAASIFNSSAVNPQYTAPATGDFTRTGTNLDKLGLSLVGAYNFNYEIQIGVAPRKYQGSAVPVFAGIVGISAFNNGTIRVTWGAATGHDGFNIYIKPVNATSLFTAPYLLCQVPSATNDRVIKTESNGITLLSNVTSYYIGIRAYNAIGEETNVVTANIIPNVDMEVKIDAIKTAIEHATYGLSALEVKVVARPTNPLLTTDIRLNDIDAAISSRATQLSVSAIPTNPLLTNDVRLNDLDATISSRLASAGYTAPDNAAITDVQTKITDIQPRVIDSQKIARNRWRVFSNQLVIYDNDGTTPLYTFNLFDQVGAPTNILPFDRQRV